MKRIGMLTSGGDCQGLNPALRGLAKHSTMNLTATWRFTASPTATAA